MGRDGKTWVPEVTDAVGALSQIPFPRPCACPQMLELLDADGLQPRHRAFHLSQCLGDMRTEAHLRFKAGPIGRGDSRSRAPCGIGGGTEGGAELLPAETSPPSPASLTPFLLQGLPWLITCKDSPSRALLLGNPTYDDSHLQIPKGYDLIAFAIWQQELLNQHLTLKTIQ